MQRSTITILAFPKASPNPYQSLLYQAVASDSVSVRQGNIKEACLGHYDVVHSHWPETFFSLPTPWQRWWGLLKFAILVLVFKARHKNLCGRCTTSSRMMSEAHSCQPSFVGFFFGQRMR